MNKGTQSSWVKAAVAVIFDECTRKQVGPTAISTQVYTKKGRTFLTKLKEGDRLKLDLGEAAAFAEALQIPFTQFMSRIEREKLRQEQQEQETRGRKQAILHAAEAVRSGTVTRSVVSDLLHAFQGLLPEALRDDETLQQAFAVAEEELDEGAGLPCHE